MQLRYRYINSKYQIGQDRILMSIVQQLRTQCSETRPPSSNPSSAAYRVTLRKLLKAFSSSVSSSQTWN